MPSNLYKRTFSLFDIFLSSGQWKLKFLKFLDYTLGSVFLYFLCLHSSYQKTKIPINLTSIKKILIIRPGGIGDAVWTIPLIRILKKNLPNSTIDVLCEQRNASIYAFVNNDISKTILYDKSMYQTIKHLLTTSYDLAVDTEQFHNFSSAFSILASKQYRVGFNTKRLRQKAYTHPIDYTHHAKEYDMFTSLLDPIAPSGRDTYLNHLTLSIEHSIIDKTQKEWLNQKPVTIYIGASIPERQWGIEKFSKLIQKLQEQNHHIALIGGFNEIPLAKKIIHLLSDPNNIVNYVGQISLQNTAAILKVSRLTIGADSGIMHLSYAVGTPSVWIFGSGIEDKWFPNFKNQIAINLHLPCSPCTSYGYTPKCPFQNQCLTGITVDSVLQKVQNLLS